MADEPAPVEPSETGQPAAETAAPVAEPKVEAAAPKPTDADRIADAWKRLPDVARTAFEGEPDDEELKAVSVGITAESLRALSPEVRATVRTLLKREAEAGTERTAAFDAREKAIADREAAAEARERDANRRHQALLKLSTVAPAPGDMPDVDPLTAEGQRALAQWAAKQAVFDAQAGMRTEADKLAKQDAWRTVVDTHPGLKDRKVKDEFDVFMRAQNEGWDGKGRPPVDAARGARAFFNDRELADLRAKEKATKAAAQTDRADGMRVVGRATTGGQGGSALDAFKRISKQEGAEGAALYLEANPEFHKRLQAEQAAL